MKLSDFYDKYTKEEVKKHFQNYISDAKWEELKDTFLFHYVVAKEKALPRAFINDHLHLASSSNKPEEIAFQEERIMSSAIYNYPLGDKLISEYGDKLDWSSISYRKDLTLEFINQHLDKIRIKDITADLGEEFISQHLLEFSFYNIKTMKLTLTQAEELIKNKKASLVDFWSQSFFTRELALNRLKELKDYATKLNGRFNFTFEEKLSVLKELDNCNFEQDEWNEIISDFMDSKELSLEQKKDLKWLAWI